MLSSQLLSYFIIITSYYIFKLLKYKPALFTNKILQNKISPFYNKLFCSVIILVLIFFQVLFWWLLAVFNRREIGVKNIIKKVF